MTENNDIPEKISAITFNPYKHHLGFLKMKIALWRKKDWSEVEQEIRYIGNNLIDLYYGKLSVSEIYSQVQQFSKKNHLDTPEKLTQWLMPLAYKKTTLSDSSSWVIKQGEDIRHFLHIHPAKYSPFTIRVKGPTLKTVIALQVFNIGLNQADVTLVNKIRSERLDLSPVKGLEKGKGIARLMANFNLM